MTYELNQLTITCRLFRDPEIKTTPSGLLLAELGVVTQDRRRQADGSYEDHPVFLYATLWESQARLAERFLRKGDRVLLEGRLRLDRWEDDAGRPRSRHRMVVDRMLFLESRDRRSGEQAASSHEVAANQAPGAGSARGSESDAGAATVGATAASNEGRGGDRGDSSGIVEAVPF